MVFSSTERLGEKPLVKYWAERSAVKPLPVDRVSQQTGCNRNGSNMDKLYYTQEMTSAIHAVCDTNKLCVYLLRLVNSVVAMV